MKKQKENLKFLKGKSVEEFALSQKLSPTEALLRLMRITHLNCSLFYKDIDDILLDDFLAFPYSIISSNGSGDSENDFKHERDYNTFPKFLNWVKEKNKISFEKAIYKITGLPAQKYGLFKRGFIKEGYFADLVVLEDDFKPREVLVNGLQVLKEGKIQEVLAGQILVRESY